MLDLSRPHPMDSENSQWNIEFLTYHSWKNVFHSHAKKTKLAIREQSRLKILNLFTLKEALLIMMVYFSFSNCTSVCRCKDQSYPFGCFHNCLVLRWSLVFPTTTARGASAYCPVLYERNGSKQVWKKINSGPSASLLLHHKLLAILQPLISTVILLNHIYRTFRLPPVVGGKKNSRMDCFFFFWSLMK